jgi:hypothetical protein
MGHGSGVKINCLMKPFSSNKSPHRSAEKPEAEGKINLSNQSGFGCGRKRLPTCSHFSVAAKLLDFDYLLFHNVDRLPPFGWGIFENALKAN